MGQAPYLIAALGIGLLVPMQLALNAQLGSALKSPALGAFFVFVVGVLAMGATLLATRTPLPSLASLAAVPRLAWLGGAIATLYILAVVAVVPKVGVGSAAVLIIAGQLAGSVVLDHLGAFGAPQVPVSLPRLGGVAMVLAGAALVRFG